MVVNCSADETAELDRSPVEEEVAPVQPAGLTLQEYEEQRKAKMSALLAKKEARVVEPVEGMIGKKVEEDYFVAEGYKGRERREKKMAAAAAAAAEEEEEEVEVILNFQAVDGLASRVERPRREEFPRREQRPRRDNKPTRGGKPGRDNKPRGGQAPKINLKNDKAFPKL